MEELKPCPFCGHDAEFLINATSASGTERGWLFGICCKYCGATTPKRNYIIKAKFCADGQIHIVDDNRKEAIEVWNRRVSE